MKLLAHLLCFMLASAAMAQNTDSAWLKNNYSKIEQAIPMRDGVKLFTAIYIPKDSSEIELKRYSYHVV